MNRLPDEFLVNIILHGGPAEGLSPNMPPFAGYLGEAQARDVIAHLRSLAQPPFTAGAAPSLVTVPGAPRQPIFFSHLIHAGSYRIDCQYCHTGARRSSSAGLPSVEKCMGCHKIIGAQDNPEICVGTSIPGRHRDGSLKIGSGSLQLPHLLQGIGAVEQNAGVVGA